MSNTKSLECREHVHDNYQSFSNPALTTISKPCIRISNISHLGGNDFIVRLYFFSVDNHNKGYMKALAMVQSDGSIFWPPIVRMRSACKMDITFFPFDDQICKLKLGSWAYDGFQVPVLYIRQHMYPLTC